MHAWIVISLPMRPRCFFSPILPLITLSSSMPMRKFVAKRRPWPWSRRRRSRHVPSFGPDVLRERSKRPKPRRRAHGVDDKFLLLCIEFPTIFLRPVALAVRLRILRRSVAIECSVDRHRGRRRVSMHIWGGLERRWCRQRRREDVL